jgi:PhnB protein
MKKVYPYLSFNGNCAEAIAHYEKAFNVKATVVLYKDSPPAMGMTELGNQVFDAQLKIDNDTLLFNDVIPGTPPANVDGNVMLTIKFDEADADSVKAAFNTLKDGGQTLMDICEVPWSKCFGLVIDKFGVKWNICQN